MKLNVLMVKVWVMKQGQDHDSIKWSNSATKEFC
jgi:hypothetical protein